MDFQQRSLKRRSLGGSLPFKKRCFRLIEQQLNGASSIPTVFSEKAAFPTTNTQDLPIFTNSYVPGYLDTFPQKIRATGSAFSAHHAPSRHHGSSSSASFSDDSEDSSAGPRPGRCHGRAGSAQAYCQRLPCYKGSNYCKRHYEQYVLKEGSSVMCRNAVETEEKSASSRSNTTQQQQPQQDKRFSGSKGEIRCSATTTRGRECAYIAVNGKKYCFMHAEYDTNPPPRRGGKQGTTVALESSQSKKKEAHRSHSNFSDSSSSSKSTDRKRRNTAEKLAQKHANSPFPLLSMISSDQWANKRVRVSVGPFEGYIGNVEKWSNGWVGVRIPDVGLHNRRSFELYLDDESTMQDLSSEQKKGIMRCVSRDAVTPSPLFRDSKRTPSPKEVTVSNITYQPVTPNPTMEEAEMRIVSKARSLDGIEMVTLPEVTPTDVPRACVNSPMIESLLTSQEHNSKLDLIFGTAAVDRSRRNIRRPKIYQDTAMLAKKRNRKDPLATEG